MIPALFWTWAVVLGLLALSVIGCGSVVGPMVGPHRVDELPALRAMALDMRGGAPSSRHYHCRGCHEVVAQEVGK